MDETTPPNILMMVGIMVPPFLVGVGAIFGGNYLRARNGSFPLLMGFLLRVMGGFITLFTGWPIIVLLTVMATEDSSWDDRTRALIAVSALVGLFGTVYWLNAWAKNRFATDN